MKSIVFGILSGFCFFAAGYCAAAATPEAKGWLVMGNLTVAIWDGMLCIYYAAKEERSKDEKRS